MILKDYVFILANYQCNKNCPYCIAKMNQRELPSFDEQIEELKRKIKTYQDNKVKFQYFILSGNGEPTLYSTEELQQIKEIVENSKIFLDYRIETSGNLFFDEEKLSLFENWLKEITVISDDPVKDKKFYNYPETYLDCKAFLKQKRIRVNLVLLKSNWEELIKIIEKYSKMSCVETIALKLLDNPKPETKEGKWITENGITHNKIEDITKLLNKHYQFISFSRKRFIYKTKQNKLLTMHHSEKNTYDEINIKDSFSWHQKKIKKGIYGEFSKIEEEVEEAKDALEQKNHLMYLIELSDIIGAIEKIAEHHNLTLEDLIAFSNKVKESKENEN